MHKSNPNKGKNRPTGLVQARSTAGLGYADPKQVLISESIGIFGSILKTVLVLGVCYLAYKKITNRFQEKKEISRYPKANITDAQAATRANAIADSIGWFSNDLANVKNNLAGLNYNGVIKVYNAFGRHTGTLLGGSLDLFEWIQNQFNKDQVAELSALLNGAFF